MKTIYTKRNGKTTIEYVENDKKNTMFKSNRFPVSDCFEGVPAVKRDHLEVNNLRGVLDTLKRTDCNTYYGQLTELFYRVITTKTVDDFISEENYHSLYRMVSSFLYNYDKPNKYNRRLSSVDVAYRKKFTNDISVMSTAAKEIVERYIRAYVKGLSDNTVDKVRDDIDNGVDPLTLIKVGEVSIANSDDKALKEFIKSLFVYLVKERTDELGEHLCQYCSVEILDCPKMMDDIKKIISEYDFIVSGKQVTFMNKSSQEQLAIGFDEEYEETETLLVTNCKKFFMSEKAKRETKFSYSKK